jgi:probable HAF family extracellular repeat protein
MKNADLCTGMNRRMLALLFVFLIFGAAYSAAADTTEQGRQHLYEITLLPSLGGMSSRGNNINERGWVSGFSNLPGDAIRHATLWRNGNIVDLGTLGDPDSSNSNVPIAGLNNRGTVVGISQTAEPEPAGEDWSCSIFFPPGMNTGFTCLGFVWESGEMKPVPTLGGNNGFATGVNSRGQISGWAENDVEDSDCVAPQVFQFRGFVWEPGKDRLTELPPFPGDKVSTGNAINERGQVVGISGICDDAVGKFSAMRAVLWDKGEVIDLGNLGGISWHTPWAINERGDVVGFSNPPGDDNGEFIAHAFLWTRHDGMQDLGTLEERGHLFSQANGINARRQIVGVSFDDSPDGDFRAFLWHDDEMTDLNTLVAPGFSGVLLDARDINEQGQITGSAFDAATGETRAFVATPVGRF